MVLLDAGHGYDTPGKRSPIWDDGVQLFEWEFNREIVKRITEKLDHLHLPYHVLVPEAKDISLRIRCERANTLYSIYKDAWGLSIHANADPDNDLPEDKIAEGWEIWTAHGESESDVIAAIFYDAASMLPFKRRSEYTLINPGPDKEARFKILTGTKCPWVLTENGFMDNEKECRYMLSEVGMNEIAEMHVQAIYKYYMINNY